MRGNAVCLDSTSTRVRLSGCLASDEPETGAAFDLLGPALAVLPVACVDAGLLVLASAWFSISSNMLKSKSSPKSDIMGDEGASLVTRVGAVERRVGERAIDNPVESTAVLALDAK